MQRYWIGTGKLAREICLPPADHDVLPGIKWGRGDMLDTPAYWALKCLSDKRPLDGFRSSGASLVEEIGFCLLGGFGVTAELNVAAFNRLRDSGVFDLRHEAPIEWIRELLVRPLSLGNSSRRYRFPNQRAARLAAMRERMRRARLGNISEIQLHEFLLSLDGIGPKTAAWILRNHFDSDSVAILDVHVLRACTRLGVFPVDMVLPRDYAMLEKRFLSFASALEVRPAVLDAIMWKDMRVESLSNRRLAA